MMAGLRVFFARGASLSLAPVSLNFRPSRTIKSSVPGGFGFIVRTPVKLGRLRGDLSLADEALLSLALASLGF